MRQSRHQPPGFPVTAARDTGLDSQRALYTAQDELVQSEQAVAANLMALYKALGGGWEVALEDASVRAADRAIRSEPDGRRS